jgi:methionyl-tRNA synthetase
MSKTSYITTSIPYVNASPHVGHAEEFVQADVIARYRRLMGDDVFFLSGTDDNALKNVLKAEEARIPIEAFVSRNADTFEELLRALNISNNDFIRTSSDTRHAPGAQKLWSSCKSEDIYKKIYKGLYCVGCEEFKLDKELLDGHCPEHPTLKLEEVEEENYFFRLSNYQQKLEELVTTGTIKVVPTSRKNEVLAFIRSGLEDFSISRSRARARNWGVPVPGDDTQVMYVWFDALSNYITALQYATSGNNFEKFWSKGDSILHIIGKGISRFHAIYWPAMLLSAGVRLPDTIFVHGYLTVSGQKMSKSLGNVIDPFELIKGYGADAFRYFITREISPFEDSDITKERFREAYNANLANGLGNLSARVLQMSSQYLETPVDVSDAVDISQTEGYRDAIEAFEFNRALNIVWGFIGILDKEIQEEKPFELIKKDKEKAQEFITHSVKSLEGISRSLIPFMPETAKKMQEAIKANRKPENLFPRKV